MSWYQEANIVINKVIKEKGNSITIKDIDNAYPFGERKRTPYKMWLKVRKEKLIKLGLAKMKTNHKQKENGLFTF